MNQYSQTIQKLVALITLVSAIVLIYVVLSPFVSTYSQNQKQISQLQDLNSRYKKIAEFQPKILSFSIKQNTNFKESWYLHPAKKSLAKANLRTRLKLIATSNGARIESIREVPDKFKQGLIYVGLHLKMSGSYQSIFQSLRKYEISEPFLFIQNLQITGDRVRQRASTKQAVLTAQFSIHGALIPNAGKAQKKPVEEQQ